MKFKYKKMVLLISMSTMLIGCVIFSTVSPGIDAFNSINKKTEKESNEEETKNTKEDDANASDDTDKNKDADEKKDAVAKKDDESQPSPSPDLPAASLVAEKDLNKDVSKIVKKYLEASVSCDMDALKTTVNNIEMIDEEELKRKYEYIEAVKNIECYMVKDPDNDAYLVYVYREMKIKDVKTLAPGLSSVYVTANEAGKYKIYFGEDTGMRDFIASMDQSDKVQELVKKVDDNLKEARSMDTDLDAFVKKLSGAGDEADAQ